MNENAYDNTTKGMLLDLLVYRPKKKNKRNNKNLILIKLLQIVAILTLVMT